MNKTIDTNMTSQKKIKLLLQENDVRFLGYSRVDYLNMFDLNQTEINNMRFLDYAGSRNGFTRAMMRDNLKAVCVDPLYHLPLNQLEGKIELACLNFERYLKENYSQILSNGFRWKNINSCHIVLYNQHLSVSLYRLYN